MSPGHNKASSNIEKARNSKPTPILNQLKYENSIKKTTLLTIIDFEAHLFNLMLRIYQTSQPL